MSFGFESKLRLIGPRPCTRCGQPYDYFCCACLLKGYEPPAVIRPSVVVAMERTTEFLRALRLLAQLVVVQQ